MSKCDVKLGSWDLIFKTKLGTYVFLIFILKIKCFKHISDHRSFLSKFDVKSGRDICTLVEIVGFS